MIVVAITNGNAILHRSIGGRYDLRLTNDSSAAARFVEAFSTSGAGTTLATRTAKGSRYQSLGGRDVNDPALALVVRLLFLGPGQYLHPTRPRRLVSSSSIATISLRRTTTRSAVFSMRPIRRLPINIIIIRCCDLLDFQFGQGLGPTSQLQPRPATGRIHPRGAGEGGRSRGAGRGRRQTRPGSDGRTRRRSGRQAVTVGGGSTGGIETRLAPLLPRRGEEALLLCGPLLVFGLYSYIGFDI